MEQRQRKHWWENVGYHPFAKYGNHDVEWCPRTNEKDGPVVFFKIRQFHCRMCASSWNKGAKDASSGSICKNCQLLVAPVKTVFGTTPYQGPRRVFGKYKCQFCGRFWVSSCSWSNLSQHCQACSAVVYPFKQSYLRRPNPLTRTESQPGPEKHHLREMCEMCMSTGTNCAEMSFGTSLENSRSGSFSNISMTSPRNSISVQFDPRPQLNVLNPMQLPLQSLSRDQLNVLNPLNLPLQSIGRGGGGDCLITPKKSFWPRTSYSGYSTPTGNRVYENKIIHSPRVDSGNIKRKPRMAARLSSPLVPIREVPTEESENQETKASNNVTVAEQDVGQKKQELELNSSNGETLATEQTLAASNDALSLALKAYISDSEVSKQPELEADERRGFEPDKSLPQVSDSNPDVNTNLSEVLTVNDDLVEMGKDETDERGPSETEMKGPDSPNVKELTVALENLSIISIDKDTFISEGETIFQLDLTNQDDEEICTETITISPTCKDDVSLNVTEENNESRDETFFSASSGEGSDCSFTSTIKSSELDEFCDYASSINEHIPNIFPENEIMASDQDIGFHGGADTDSHLQTDKGLRFKDQDASKSFQDIPGTDQTVTLAVSDDRNAK